MVPEVMAPVPERNAQPVVVPRSSARTARRGAAPTSQSEMMGGLSSVSAYGTKLAI
jgi:hypothetical protein